MALRARTGARPFLLCRTILPSTERSEGNVLIANRSRGSRCRLRLGGALIEIIAARGSATRASCDIAAVAASTEQQQVAGNNFCHVAFLVGLLVVPRTGLQATFDVY